MSYLIIHTEIPEIQASGGRCHGTIQRGVQEHAEEGTATDLHPLPP